MKKIIFSSNILLLTITAVIAYVYNLNGGLFLKGLTSFCFVLIGGINTFYLIKHIGTNKKFASLTFTALLLSMLGDIILNIEFIIGAVIFALGHICYLFAFAKRTAFSKKDAVFGCLIFTASLLFLLLMPMLDFGSTFMQAICIIYALIISFMVGKAVSNAISEKRRTDRIIALGSVLFFISDMMLVLYVFGGANPLINTFCLFTYVPAQCVFAVSALSAANE